MFTFFTSLADAYSKVLMPPKGLTEKLKKSVPDMTTVLERCVNRLEWERSQEQARKKAEDEVEQERVQMAMIDWHDFVVVETIDFADDEDEELPPPMTIEEVIRRSKVTAMEEDIVEPGKEVEMEMDEEEAHLVEEGMRAASLEDNDDEVRNEIRVTEDPEPPMRIVKNWKRPEDRIPAERDPTKFVVSPITGELIPISEMSEHMRISLIDPKYKEQKERMFAKIRETTLAQDDEISRNIVGLARTRPDIFGTTEEEVSNAVKAEIEKNDEQPKQVIWDGHTGSIGRTTNQALSQNIGEDQNDASNNEAMNLPGPAAPPPRPGMPSIRPLPPPPGLALNLPRGPLNAVQYSAPNSGGFQIPQPRPPVMHMMPSVRPPPPPMQMNSGQHMGGPPQLMHPPYPMNSQGIPIPPPPLPQGVAPPPPPDEAPPPLPEEPEPRRQKHDDSTLIPEDQFLAQHPVWTMDLTITFLLYIYVS
ncbi:putative splicing factor 3A subunit 1 [Lupinus albus]|uniref:Putative splicing factor 3A subunit 1 n=1 Tax=Lupinus albus TaxID=3870 RepID=A0A6A4QYD4_LUPAL|nr:putative splicing factor 3A subunit 1 [Lupinus albus]